MPEAPQGRWRRARPARAGRRGPPCGRQRRAQAGGGRHRIGELGRVRGGQRDHRRRAQMRLGHMQPAGGVRADQLSGCLARAGDGGGGLVLRGGAAGKARAQPRQRPLREPEAARVLQLRHQLRHRRRLAVVEVEQQPLEIGADLDVHRRRERGHHARLAVLPALQRAVQDVVAIGGDHQPLHRQAHAPRDITREDVAEIARGHAEADGPPRRAQADRGGEVIDHLRQHPRPVDRVDAGQPHPVAEGVVVEHVLQRRLAVVEIAVHRQRMHVGLGGRGHLPALHLRDAAVRIQDEHVHAVEAAERLDRGRAGVAAGGADDRHALVPAGQHMLEHLPDQLHRHVLERQRRPVEQFQQEVVGADLLHRAARGVAEGGVGARDDGAERVLGEGVGHERAHDAERDLLVRQPRQRRDLGLGHRGPGLGHVQAAVAGQPAQHRLLEAQRGRLPACRDVSHPPLTRRRGARDTPGIRSSPASTRPAPPR